MRCEFDRGTIILRDLPPGVAAGLPAVTWDDRIAAHRAAALHWPEIREALEYDGVLRGVRHEEATRTRSGVQAALELRAYQRAALDAWTACGRRGVVVLPSGSGKTRVALAAIAALDLPTLVLVPTRVILAQWTAQLSAIGTSPIGRLGDGHGTVAHLTVATYESAWRHAAGLGDRFGLLIVDEAHHVGGALLESMRVVAVHREVEVRPLADLLPDYATLAQSRWSAWRRKHLLEDRTPPAFGDLLADVINFVDRIVDHEGPGQHLDPIARRWG